MKGLIQRWCFCSALMVCLGAPLAAVADVGLSGAWVRAMPPGQRVTALYLEVVNHSKQDCTLLAVATPVAQRSELHRTIEEDGMARMRHQESLPVPSHTTLRLAPGADHAMLYGIEERLRPGMTVPVEVDLGTCGQLSTEAVVRDATGVPGEQRRHHHHNHH